MKSKIKKPLDIRTIAAELKTSNKETLEAFQELEYSNPKVYDSAEEMFSDIDK